MCVGGGGVNRQFYNRKFRFTLAEPQNAIRSFTSQNVILNTVIPILMHFFFHIFTFQMYYLAFTASASSNVKPDVSQSEAMFHNDVGFATVSDFDAVQADFALYSSVH